METILFSPASQQLAARLKDKNYSSSLLFADRTAFDLYGASIIDTLKKSGLHANVHCFEPGEQAKSLQNAEACWQKMHSLYMDRRTLLITLGGGVAIDMGGFIASCYMRGIDVVHIPTTLLAMIDASIGGKTSVNLPSGKNLVGTFYLPQFILLDPTYLNSLSDKEFRSGLAEAIKYGVIASPSFFEFLENNHALILERNLNQVSALISQACVIKQAIIANDPYEKDLRAILNYGHTFAHAIEAATEYKDYAHGEAVSIGMSCAAHASLLLGMANFDFFTRQESLCNKLGLPTKLPKHLKNHVIIRFMQGDKKNVQGKIRLVLPKEIGKVVSHFEASLELIDHVLTLQKVVDY